MAKNDDRVCASSKVESAFGQEVETGVADETTEAAYYLETLKANRRIAEEGEPLRAGQTHRIERDEKGHEILRRKRFSAV